jgi:hypothetical protein
MIDKLTQKYGPPQHICDLHVTWIDNRPWKKTTVHRGREVVAHNVPVPHHDFLEQTVDYKVPVEAFEGLARFDGSLYPDRTRGTLTAYCHKEEANFMAINLAHEYITTFRSRSDIMAEAVKINHRMEHGDLDERTQKFMFPVQRDTADPGMFPI